MLRLLTYNIHYGIGMDGRCDLDRIAAEFQDADIIGLQEVERHWDRTGNLDQPAELLSRLPGFHMAWGANVDVLKRSGLNAGQRRQFGNVILSRFPILSIRNHLLPKYGAAQMMDMQRGALEAVVELPSGKALRVYSTHFCHLSDDQRLIQAEHLLALHRRAAEDGPPIFGRLAHDASWEEDAPLSIPHAAILLGDFNCRPYTPAYRALAGDLSERHGPIPRHGRFVDAWAHLYPKLAAPDVVESHTRYDSFESRKGRRIDYCLVSESYASFLKSAVIGRDSDASDHQPLLVTMDDPA